MALTPLNSATLHATMSVCPVCLRRVRALYAARGDEVWFVKDCPQHGRFEALVWRGAGSFEAWRQPGAAQLPKAAAMPTARGCPYDCGLCANHRQATCCVLLEVTRRCDLRCPVCFASAGAATDAAGDPTLRTIESWYDMLLERGGPFNIQLSGGEPTQRDDLADVIRLGKRKGFSFFQLNTNGLRIADDPAYLHELARAGLNTVFLQFDGLSAASTLPLRGRDVTSHKLRAIERCEHEGLGVVLVPTLLRGANVGEIGALLDFAAAHMPTVRGVHFQPMSYFGRYDAPPAPDARLTLPDLLAAIEAQTNSRLKAADFAPGGAEHPLCSCHADYEIDGGRWTLVRSTPSCCGSGAVATSDAARKAVAGKWSRPAPPDPAALGDGFDVSALDDFLERRATRTLAISAMAFMDAWTVDLERLERCYINIVSPDGRLLPFCACNLTAMDGTALYR